MGVEDGINVFILLKEGRGWISSDTGYLSGTSRLEETVPRGSLAETVDTTQDCRERTSIQVRILDDRNVKMVPLVADLKLIGKQGDQVYQLLRGVRSHEQRYNLVLDGRLQDLRCLRTGSAVLYAAPGYPEVPAVVRYLGQGPEGGPGWVVGLEVKNKSWELGTTSGVINGRKYFDPPCEENKGVFCDMSRIKPCQTKCDNSYTLHGTRILQRNQSETSSSPFSGQSGSGFVGNQSGSRSYANQSAHSSFSNQTVRGSYVNQSEKSNFYDKHSEKFNHLSENDKNCANVPNSRGKGNITLSFNNRDSDSSFLKKFRDLKHQDPGSESYPVTPVRPGRRKPSESSEGGRFGDRGRGRAPSEEPFSWNPNNSNRKKYDKSRFEERKGRRTPEPRPLIPELYPPARVGAGDPRRGTKEWSPGEVETSSGRTSSSYEELQFPGAGDRPASRAGDRPASRTGTSSRPSSRVGQSSRPSSRIGDSSRPDSRTGGSSRTTSRVGDSMRTSSRAGDSSRRGEFDRPDGFGRTEGSSSRQDGSSRMEQRSPRSRMEGSTDISLEFTDPQESEDQWSVEQGFPPLPDTGHWSKGEEQNHPWSEELSQVWRRDSSSSWREKEINHWKEEANLIWPEELPRRVEPRRQEKQQSQTKNWGEVLNKTNSAGSLSSNGSDKREVEEAPRFDELVKEGSEQVAQVAAESMVQLERAGQPVFGVVRWRGSVGDQRDWVGVELEDQVPGGGTGVLQGRKLFSCPQGKGIFVPVTQVRPDPRFGETVGGTQEFGSLDSPILPGIIAPHPAVTDVGTVAGRNRGIQGHQNSCYLDATLFSMFTFTSVFDSLLYRPRNKNDIPQYDEVRKVLRDDIVNPLRQRLFVRADRVMTLRTMLANLSNVSGLTDQEKDPEEFLNSLLNQVLKANPYLELSSGQSSHTYQLFVEKDPDLIVPTLQELFDQSFLSSGVKLTRAPPVLILQMPRFGRQFKMYDRVVPTQILDITDVISGVPRQCVICGQLATLECPQCYGDHEQGLQSTAFCDSCVKQTHHHARRKQHVQTRLDRPVGWKQDSRMPRINMDLVAVVCIETSHYVSFVRCGDTLRSPWAFFDSMADRKGEQNGYNIPELTPAPEVETILSDAWAKRLRDDPTLPLSAQAKRLVSDAYICFYQSPEVRMYK